MKIQFLKSLNDAILPVIPEDTYVIYHKTYENDLPKIEGVKMVEFEEFKTIYANIHANMYIIFGLNRIITPSNRTHFVFEHLFTLTSDVDKYSIDYFPFVGEPWRLWFHYGLCQVGKFGVPYSYTIETEWKHWFYRNKNDSRFQKDNLNICITDTFSNLDTITHNVTFYEPNEVDLIWYREAKEYVFENHHTPKMLINNLLKLCNKRFKITYGYDSYLSKNAFLLPELNVYKFLHEENKRRVNTFNVFTKKRNL